MTGMSIDSTLGWIYYVVLSIDTSIECVVGESTQVVGIYVYSSAQQQYPNESSKYRKHTKDRIPYE